MVRLRTLLLLVVVAAAACGTADRTAEFQHLGPFLDGLMAEHGVPGIEFAVFDDSGLLYEHVSGVKDAATREVVDSETAFEAASISKPLFAYLVLSLVQDGLVELDTPLTPRVLLTHMGGLPNWRSRMDFDATRYEDRFPAGDTLRFVHDPGSAYLYSGEGYVLLQRVVEARTGMSLVDLMAERVFEPLGMSRSAMLFDTEMRRNHARGHNPEGESDKWIIRLPLASTTLHTTAGDLALFGAAVATLAREGGPYAEMAEPAVPVNKDADAHWGLGLGVIDSAEGRYVWHGGNNVIFIADLIYGLNENLGYVLLTNSANGSRMVPALEQRVFGRRVRR